jgi:hypothetical protein
MLVHALRRLAGTGFTALALATAACGGGDGGDSTGPGPVPADITGTYALTSMRTLGNLQGGGNGMPVSFTDGGGSTLRFLSGQLVLAADGTYTLAVEAEYNGGDVTMTDEGQYQLEGATIDFDPTGSPQRMATGTVSGSSITAETQFGGIPFEVDLDK